jgi:hypothetical protein
VSTIDKATKYRALGMEYRFLIYGTTFFLAKNHQNATYVKEL